MKHVATWALAAIGMVAIAASGAAAADADIGESGTTQLTLELNGPAAQSITPSWALRRNRFGGGGIAGKVKIAGTDVLISARTNGISFWLGLDRNGNNDISSAEWLRVRRSKSYMVTFTGKIEGKPFAVRIFDIEFRAVGRKIQSFGGRAAIVSCMKGDIGRIPVRILDDDMSGQFTQNGRDAILIGDSATAVPLKNVHRLGEQFYRLTVDPEGVRIEYSRLADVQTGKVRAPLPVAALRCLVLASKEGAYNAMDCERTGIPADDYALAFGVVAGRHPAPFTPGSSRTTYPIQANMVNTMRLGEPLRVIFSVTLKEREISVSPRFTILGIGGERYGPLDYLRRGKTCLPRVKIVESGRVMFDGPMSYG